MTDKDRAVLDEKTKNFIRNSKIILGISPPTKETNYLEVMKDPKDHFASITMIKYNSNMINIIYIPSLNSLFLRTLSWGFDCYNRDKDRKYIANRNMSYINTDYQKVWDPITNRFFYGTLQHQL